MADTCPYCDAPARPVPDAYGDGGYRECAAGCTFHVGDWPEVPA